LEKIPERLRWAVEKLNLTGDETILEIGCGRGVAVSLVCPQLRSGTIMAIDRSATAIEAARKRNEAFAAAGRAIFHQAAVEDFKGANGAFDVVFAVNVNQFWLDAQRALDSVRLLLARDGRLHLFYEAPSPGQRMKIAAALPGKLAASGFEVVETEEQAKLLAVVARSAG
jgi:cyclopropane fatty-acyl-phospholipid synthase-like methyltransferase